MKRLCLNCHYYGKSTNPFWYGSIIIGLIEIALGAILLYDFDPSAPNPIIPHTIIKYMAVFLIISGFMQIILRFRKYHECPECLQKKMVTINSKEAQEVIQKHKLRIKNYE